MDNISNFAQELNFLYRSRSVERSQKDWV